MHKPESVWANEMHKIIWDFGLQTDHQIAVRRSNLVLINKKKRICHLVDLTVPADHRREMKEGKMIDKYLDLARELIKSVERSLSSVSGNM